MKERKHITDGRKCWCNPKIISYKNKDWRPSSGDKVWFVGLINEECQCSPYVYYLYYQCGINADSNQSYLRTGNYFSTKSLAQAALKKVKKVLKKVRKE